jgi:murein DD-endopeptidase MepM/ murein hydrolase activator NlpD
VVAAAEGLIVRADRGAVVQDLDGDGSEHTGWTILYMHIRSDQRVEVGSFLRAGEKIGHPSCEGGFSTGTHLHIARRYNGEWIPADQDLPFNLDGWISAGVGSEYDGFLKRNGQSIEAWNGRSAENEIKR